MTTITASLVTCAGFICVGGGTPAHFMDRAAAIVAETKLKGIPMTNEPTAFELPPVPDHPESCIADHWSPYELSAISAYGHACAEAARAPLLERIAKLERSVIECANTGVRMMDAADQEIARLRADLAAKAGEVEALRAGIQKAIEEIDDAGPKALKYARQELETAIAQHSTPWVNPLAAEVESLKSALAAERAASVIEWEPGRSYTAAELLRRAIRGLRVRKDHDLWPAVRNMCGVGSNVAHYLCRWAGRDPDTGKDIAGRKGEGSEGAAQAKEGAE